MKKRTKQSNGDSPVKRTRKRVSDLPVAKVMCSTCIFRDDGNELELREGRLDQIRIELIQGCSFVCHGPLLHHNDPKVLCRGARDFQLQCWHRMGVIGEPTDESLSIAQKEAGF
jgi:hypothetical protein